MAKSSCPTRGASLLCIRKPSIASAATAAVSCASARQNISTCTRSPRLLGQFSARYPAVKLQIELGIGPDISALLDEGELDLVIVSNEIREGEGPPRPCWRCPILNLCRAGAATARSRQTISPR